MVREYAIAIVQDIAKRKAFEQELTKSIEQRDRFLATLSHELRNPLAALRHSLAIIRHTRADNESKTSAIRTVSRQAEQMAHLLDDLLDVSRITQDKIRYLMRPLDLRCVVQDAVDAMRPAIELRHHTMSCRLPEHCVPVNGDESRLLQVVENLLTNACKYTPPHGQIDVQLNVDDARCELVVSDTGQGIAADAAESIFGIFFQSDRPLDRCDGGMGLGLTVARS